MRIDASIREAFRAQLAVAQSLKQEVDAYFLQFKPEPWHYLSRIKSLESLASKAEAGKIRNLSDVEDLFAATLVVPTAAQLSEAEALVVTRFGSPFERRPREIIRTTKSADSFGFDDIRMYVRYTRGSAEPVSLRDGAPFEIQVKTFLQHAWGIATHDVTYKTTNVDWRRERIAHQIRATLEQAEVAVGSMELLAQSDVLPRSDQAHDDQNEVIRLLLGHWDASALPGDLRRLSETLRGLVEAVVPVGAAPIEELGRVLLRGRERLNGGHSIDYSPYRSVLNYVATDHGPGLLNLLKTPPVGRSAVLVYPEVFAQLGLQPADAPGGIEVPALM